MKKIISIFLIVLIVLVMVLFALGVISSLIFWMVIIVVGLLAYKVIPKMET